MKNAGSLIALLVVGVVAYMFRGQLAGLFSSAKSGDFVATRLNGMPANLYIGAPTDSNTPQFGTQDLENLFNHGQNPAPPSTTNPFKPQGYTLDQILALPNSQNG